MKKFYVLIVACFFCTVWANAQTYYWVGPSSGSGGLWSDANNWSSSSGGSGGAGIPNGAGENVVIDQNAVVNVDISSSLSTFTVTNNASALLYINSGTVSYTITLLSTSSVNPALKIDAGCKLTDSADIDLFLTFAFYNNTKGLVNGSWIFTGSSAVMTKGASYSFSGTGSIRLDINGTMEYRNNSAPPPPQSSEGYVFFNSGSSVIISSNGGAVPYGAFDAASTIYMTGAVTSVPAIQNMAVKEIGNLVYNCPSMNIPAGYGSLALPNHLLIKGNVNILNTNNQYLVLATNGSGGLPLTFDYTVQGSFNISGTSRVAVAKASSTNKDGVFQINGNLVAGGTSFDLQIGDNINISSNSTTLRVKGNINHTAGTINVNNSTKNNTSVDLYVIEMNGSSPQTISSWNGSLDNSTNEVTLLMNNAAGVTLSTAVAVGKISWNSAGKGLLNTTAAHVLTINNTGTHSLVVNSPGSTGYVSGPVRRRTAGVGPYVMPTGKGGTYHSCSFAPSGSTASVYQAEYFNTAYSDLSVLSPLNGVSNLEYWTANTISGTQSSLALSLNGTAVPGATALDDVAVGRFNGTDWVYFSGNAGGSVITPGNLTTGTTGSGNVTINGTFTFAFGPTGALPVDLLSFDARKVGSSSARLTWTVSDNSTPQKFVVMSSKDGSQFSEIGTVTAVSGQTRYTFDDNNLGAGTTYYRLRLVDIDGTYKLSRIVAIVNRGTGAALITALSPTVVHSTAQLSVSSNKSGAMLVAVTDGYGRVVKQLRIAVAEGSQQVQLNFMNLPAGVYQLTGYLDGERAGTVRFIKQ